MRCVLLQTRVKSGQTLMSPCDKGYASQPTNEARWRLLA